MEKEVINRDKSVCTGQEETGWLRGPERKPMWLEIREKGAVRGEMISEQEVSTPLFKPLADMLKIFGV